MKELNAIVAQNLTELRKKSGLTQQQLAAQFNYSDKTISKWELGHAIPSVDVLKNLAEFYGVSVDYILKENEQVADVNTKKTKSNMDNRVIFVLLINTVILLIGTVIFVWTCIAYNTPESGITPYWQAFVWAAAACFGLSALIVWRWWKQSKTTWLVLSTCFVWILITAFFCQFISETVWYIYFVGIPVEFALVLISRMK